ncbi:MAG TPA: CBS domain-containing protein [Spirochaetota bacterium]|nr:CBS domain-containing protein [Spirochaetota bacterium]
MFHLFTLQGKRIDAQLEQLPKTVRVHHTRSNSRVKKFVEGDPQGRSTGGSAGYAADVYKEAMNIEYEKAPVFHASEIMSSPVFTIGPDVYVNDAWKNFSDKKVHHMPVISPEGKLIGIVSDRDLLKKLIISDNKIETARDAAVGDIMSTEVIATSPLTDIRRIAKAMLDHHVDAMPVVGEDGAITGIITRSDILYAIIHNPELQLWA